MTPTQLREEWQGAFGLEAPNLGTGLLRRLLAQRLQQKRLGGLSVMVMRELERTVAAGPVVAPVRTRMKLSPGARLIRMWNGRTIAVLTTEAGFIWEEREYRSLTQIAWEVTSARWPRFFGLTGRG